MTQAFAAHAVELTDGRLRLAALPELGARVVSLRSTSGREWLADSGRRWPARTPSRWDRGDLRGWDECFPNIGAGAAHPDTGVALADHGDVWNRPWRQIRGAGLSTTVDCASVPVSLTRELRLAGGVEASYTARNTGEQRVDVMWAMHLLLDADAAEIELAPDVPVRVDSGFGTGPLPGSWTSWGRVRSLLPWERDGWGVKLFTQPGTADAIAVVRDDETLRVRTGPGPAGPVFGVWINRGALPAAPDVRHLGIEAGYGDHDDLAAAIASSSTLSIAPRTAVSWRVDLDIGHHRGGGRS